MADRNYSKAFEINRASPVFNYVWDSSLLITGAGEQVITGGWKPYVPSAGGGGEGGTTDMTATNAKLDTLIAYSATLNSSANTLNTSTSGLSALSTTLNSTNSGISASSATLNATNSGILSAITTLNAATATLNATNSGILAYEAPSSKTCSVNFTGSLLGKAGAGTVHSVFGYCSGNAQFLRIYDGTSTAGSLIGVIAIGAQNNFSVDFLTKGASVSSGVFAALSSSASSHVATGNDAIITIIWK